MDTSELQSMVLCEQDNRLLQQYASRQAHNRAAQRKRRARKQQGQSWQELSLDLAVSDAQLQDLKQQNKDLLGQLLSLKRAFLAKPQHYSSPSAAEVRLADPQCGFHLSSAQSWRVCYLSLATSVSMPRRRIT